LESENDGEPQLGNGSNDDSGSQAENEAPDAGPSLPNIPDSSVGSFGCEIFATNL